jgi:pSer/pThr/pTyr-binding forkhead associated (FHA) protein
MIVEQPSGAYLVIHKASMAGRRIELWKDCTTLGRSSDCDIFLEDITVHRKQASIVRTPAGYVLRDDHGSGDSFVNEVPVQREQLLNSGDHLRFGNTVITFYASEGTRPFQLPVSRRRELHMGRTSELLPPAYLEVINTRSLSSYIELLPEMTIGRSRESSIFLEDLAVSRLHATIRELPSGDYELLDHRSATGTFVNGRAMARCVLRDGDEIQIGSTRFVFRLAHQ